MDLCIWSRGVTDSVGSSVDRSLTEVALKMRGSQTCTFINQYSCKSPYISASIVTSDGVTCR